MQVPSEVNRGPNINHDKNCLRPPKYGQTELPTLVMSMMSEVIKTHVKVPKCTLMGVYELNNTYRVLRKRVGTIRGQWGTEHQSWQKLSQTPKYGQTELSTLVMSMMSEVIKTHVEVHNAR